MSLAAATEKQCVICKTPFLPFTTMQTLCGKLRCAQALGRGFSKQRRESTLREAKQTRERRAALKTRSDYIREAQVAVNRYVRLRDHGKGCISCGAKPEARFGGAMDAGHFRSVGSAPHLRYYLPQIRLQCVRCNRYLAGNAIEFRRGLVERIGVAKVEEIEAMQGVAKWNEAYLARLTKIMRKKARRLEKRHAV